MGYWSLYVAGDTGHYKAGDTGYTAGDAGYTAGDTGYTYSRGSGPHNRGYWSPQHVDTEPKEHIVKPVTTAWFF